MEGYTDVIVAHQYRLPERRGRAGHRAGRVAHPPAEAPCRSHRAGSRRRRGGHEAGQRGAWSCSSPSRPICESSPCPKTSTRAIICTSTGPRRFRELLATKAVDALDHAYEVTTRGHRRGTRRAWRQRRRSSGCLASWPRPRGSAATHPRRCRIQEQKIVQRLAGKFRVDEHRPAAAVDGAAAPARRRGRAARPGRGPADEPAGRPAEPIDPWQRRVAGTAAGPPREFGRQSRADRREDCLPPALPADLRNVLPVGRRGHLAHVRPADVRVRPTGDEKPAGRARRAVHTPRGSGPPIREALLNGLDRYHAAKGDAKGSVPHRSRRCAKEDWMSNSKPQCCAGHHPAERTARYFQAHGW